MNDPYGYYDRQGRPLEWMTAWRLMVDMDYKRVELTHVGGLTVSTVWLGLDHAFNGGPPVIFETMVFDAWGEDGHVGDEVDGHTRRYSTEAQARTGHNATVILLRYEQEYGDPH